MRREVSGTLWVVVTLITVVFFLCAMACVIGLTTYEITDQAR